MWRDAGGRALPETDTLDSRPPYLLSAFVVLAPLTPLPWPAARVASLVITIGLVALAIVALAHGLPAGAARLWFAGGALAMAPLHTGIRTSTVSIAAVAFLMLSVWASTRGRAITAGIFIALASLKPQLALPFLVYHVVRQNYRVAASAAGTWALLMAVGAARLAVADVPWLAGYAANMRLVLDDPKNLFTPDNPLRFQLVNLQPFVYSLVANASVADAVSIALAAALLIVWLARVRRNERRSELLEVGTLSVIALLPVYHRFYDAWLLALPLCWALATSTTPHRSLALALLTPFVVPIVGLAQWLVASGYLPAELANQAWWNAVVLSLQIWSLLILAAVLVAAMGRPTAAAAGTSSTQAAFQR